MNYQFYIEQDRVISERIYFSVSGTSQDNALGKLREFIDKDMEVYNKDVRVVATEILDTEHVLKNRKLFDEKTDEELPFYN